MIVLEEANPALDVILGDRYLESPRHGADLEMAELDRDVGSHRELVRDRQGWQLGSRHR